MTHIYVFINLTPHVLAGRLHNRLQQIKNKQESIRDAKRSMNEAKIAEKNAKESLARAESR